MTSIVEVEKSVGCLKTAGFLMHSFAKLTGVLKSAFRLWSNSSPRVRLAGRGKKFGVKQQKSLGLPRLFEQQLAERQRFELWEDSHPRRFSRPLH